MIVKKTQPIKLEFVVRDYITGSTNTSLWTMYNNGMRELYDIKLRDGYQKNEKLDITIITPTTKGNKDIPINKQQIIEQNYLTEEEYNFIANKSLELFRYGRQILKEKGIILVDTKYEFGRLDNKIILIDEIHTSDSSRLWIENTYQHLFNNNKEPEKIDKDIIRDWVKTKCNPYKENIPTIPKDLIEKTYHIYQYYYSILSNPISII